MQLSMTGDLQAERPNPLVLLECQERGRLPWQVPVRLR